MLLTRIEEGAQTRGYQDAKIGYKNWDNKANLRCASSANGKERTLSLGMARG
jgi:hypothetical protein